jgi:ribosomal-protein-alanine N-acetyltransferase
MIDPKAIFDSFPQLATERFVLREIRPSDAPAVFACFADDAVTRYYDQPTYTDIKQAEDLILHMRHSYRDRRSIRWGIARRSDDLLLGTCGYMGWDRRSRKCSLGYELAQAYWRQGVMREVLTAVLPCGFEQMNLNRIEAEVIPGNIASEQLLQKLGFQREGLMRQSAYFKEAFYDLQLFALLKEERA